MWSTLRTPMMNDEDEGEIAEVVGRSPPRTPAHAEAGGLVRRSSSGSDDDHVVMTDGEDDTIQEDYVPDSLKSFFRQAKDTLIESQKGLFVGSTDGAGSIEANSTNSFDFDSPRHGFGQEDEEDVRLKGEILDRFSPPTIDNHHPVSPDLFQSPPPNPVMLMSESEIKRSVMEGASPPLTMQSPPPPPPTRRIEATTTPTRQGIWSRPKPAAPMTATSPPPPPNPPVMYSAPGLADKPMDPPSPPRVVSAATRTSPPLSWHSIDSTAMAPRRTETKLKVETSAPSLFSQPFQSEQQQHVVPPLLDEDDDRLIDTLMQDGVEIVDLTNMPSDHYDMNRLGTFGGSAWDYGGAGDNEDDDDEEGGISFVHEASETSYVGDVDETAMVIEEEEETVPAPVTAPVGAPSPTPPPEPIAKPAMLAPAPSPEPVAKPVIPAPAPSPEPIAKTVIPSPAPSPEPIAKPVIPVPAPSPEPIAKTVIPAPAPSPEPIAKSVIPARAPSPKPVVPAPAPPPEPVVKPVIPAPPEPIAKPVMLAPAPSPEPVSKPVIPTSAPSPMAQLPAVVAEKSKTTLTKPPLGRSLPRPLTVKTAVAVSKSVVSQPLPKKKPIATTPKAGATKPRPVVAKPRPKPVVTTPSPTIPRRTIGGVAALPRVAGIRAARRAPPPVVIKEPATRPVSSTPVSSRLLRGTSASVARRRATVSPKVKVEAVPSPKSNSYAHVSSRLMDGTAASEARLSVLKEPQKVVSPDAVSKVRDNSVPSRLLRGTAASQARLSSLHEPAEPVVISAADGRAKARERVRLNLLAQKQEREAQLAEEQPKVSPAEGVAKARERIRQWQLQERPTEKDKRTFNFEVSSGPRKLTVPQAPRFSTIAKSRDAGRPKRVSSQTLRGGDAFVKGLRDDRSVSSAGPRTTLTVPQAPTFATSARPREKIVRDSAGDVTLAQSSDFLAKGLRDERVAPSTVRRAGLTIPQAPKFATSARHVEKPPRRDLKVNVTVAQGSDAFSKGLRDDISVSSMSQASTGHKTLTTPKGPHFLISDRHGEKVETPRAGGDDHSLAQSTNFLIRELRKPTPTLDRSGLTLAKSPQFHRTAKRELPQSSADKEKELMDFFKTHPFKAAPNLMNAKPRSVAKKPTNRRLTTPEPFHLVAGAKKRTVTGKQSRVLPEKALSAKEAADLEEMKKKFHARPVPKFPQTTNLEQKRSPPKVTKPQPFNLATEKLARHHRNEPTSGVKPDLRAAPVPKLSKPASPTKKSPRNNVTKPVPFTFASERLKSEHRRAATHPDDAELTKQFKAAPVPDFSITSKPKRSPTASVTKAKPFEFASSKLKSEHRPTVTIPDDVELMKQFKARPVPNFSVSPKTKPSPTGSVTKPIPFDFATGNLKSEHRVVATNAEPTKQFKARPVPDFSVTPKPRRSPTGTITKPEPFELASSNLKSEFRGAVTSPNKMDSPKQFKARPLPDFSITPKPKWSPTGNVTKPQPFELSSGKSKSEHRAAVTSPDDALLLKQFKARPLPTSTFRSPQTPSPNGASLSAGGGPGSDISQKRLAASEASRRRTEALAQQSNGQGGSPQVGSPSAQTPRAEGLTSAERRQVKHERLLAEQQRQESVDRMRQTFRAKPVPKSTYQSPPTPSRRSNSSSNGSPVEYVVFS